MHASDIARAAGGRLEGGADPEISGAAPHDHAGPADLTLLASSRYLADADSTAAGVILVSANLADRVRPDRPHIVVKDAHAALAAVLPLLYPEAPREPGIHPSAVLEAGVRLGAGVTIGPFAHVGAGTEIGDGAVVSGHVSIGRLCRIGADAYLHPQVTMYDGVTLGERSILHSGVRVGVDGFGYTFRAGRHVKVPHVGRCTLGADVEIGANSTVDRGSIGATVISDGCKIDNLVHIGHNVRLGEHCIVVAQTGISGSTRAGKYVTFGGQAGINGHINIGDGATIAARSGVFGDVEPGLTVSGYPARPHKEALRAQAGLFKLPDMMKRLRALERAVLGRGAKPGSDEPET
ncbi:MAG TPA: UDP-3-O-(3-hydroxymyristoyl)glucosamine N-acyltransferase [Longimicrobiales bacterium]|nr:UDP-3-O-(3-hydroxymyristoyl)glucosamine N-acyltransferase [Longimicrobiales bacterium]